uniref:GDNF family receptor alpha-4 n=1 Tax=Myodes glareolus TaxID=447135 RepID=UPI0020222181|nr:GDNF family receptor alpha-4 [Myodes glareolus]
MACCLESALLLLLLHLLGSASSTGGNRCVAAAEACTADAQCQQLRSEYVARCLGRAAPKDWSGPGGCPAPGSRDSCPEERGPRCRLAYAGLIGTAVTPNYLDNVSARVAPWCGCEDSGNRLEECEAFRKLFTRNPCLDGAMQAFNPLWPSILQDWMKPYQNTGHCFPQVSSMSVLTALALQALL